MVGGGVVCCCSLVLPAKAAKNYRLARLRKRDLLKAAALWNLEGEKIR